MKIIQVVNLDREDLGLYIIPPLLLQAEANIQEILQNAFNKAPDNPEDYLHAYHGIKRLFVDEMILIDTETTHPDFFYIDGYWKDTKNLFIGHLVKSTDDAEEDDDNDDQVFYYGLDERLLREAVELGDKTAHEFTITSYKKATPPWIQSS